MNLPLRAAAAVLGTLVLAACASPLSQAQQDAQRRVAVRDYYRPINDVEFSNYERRQKLADDPAVILWCTAAFQTPGLKPITVPVQGKLTSGNKRPYATSVVNYQSTYTPELPGPDGMFGTSGEYRYGFTPAGVYVDFYNLETFCTTEPYVWQTRDTEVVVSVDANLNAATKRAQVALKAGDSAGAQRILDEATKGHQ